ncbi:spermatogenesis-associated protein 22 [Lampris incognitus]|uniref:spermatogenesis-associated protein 22 n=1 Tax=Lampris incognitus TaxID=2546036 RepID=UPI0024B4BFAC|nr:spermatogenesis-associated protein 22 [Lampris incognitus]
MARPTAGCLTLPLFNYTRDGQTGWTSTPSENEYMSANSSSNYMPDAFGGHQASGYLATPQNYKWDRKDNPQVYQQHFQYGNNWPAPGPAPTTKTCTPLPHPNKTGNTSSPMRQQQHYGYSVGPRQNSYQGPYNSGGFSPMDQLAPSRQANPRKFQFSPQPRPLHPSFPPAGRPPTQAPHPQNTSGPQRASAERNSRAHDHQTESQTQTQTPPAFQIKPKTESSFRMLTAVIGGMRHWNQYKNKVPCLFEILATLDSAVTLGSHGAKTFLMRDGKDVVQCVFYENENELPRLIRGHVHRCVGNYNATSDTLMCVSVRAGLPSEQSDAKKVVKVCDMKMRALVKPLHEV